MVAANVRALLAWKGLSGQKAAALIGIKQRSMSNKLRGVSPFTADELLVIARLLGLDDPGQFYRWPTGFPE